MRWRKGSWTRFYDRWENVIGMTLLVTCYILIAVTGAVYMYLAATGQPLR